MNKSVTKPFFSHFHHLMLIKYLKNYVKSKIIKVRYYRFLKLKHTIIFGGNKCVYLLNKNCNVCTDFVTNNVRKELG